ncbi:uncharacterized protein OCT59_021614 [Rhizophagus irregularis]|uniref:uncharacterized protein n=1 Tax=Rhizophagus irregularis TaxID=588596 RepID=UPI00331DA2E8|nr:hypothetical protein OCT59_021614 [Rhizophagus irregularis]
MSSAKLFDRLSMDLLKILENSQNYDVIIKIGGEYPDSTSSYMFSKKKNKNEEISYNCFHENDCCKMEEFYVHSLLLSARSPYFRAALSNEWAKKDEKGIIVLKKPNISPKVFKVILKYIYTDIYGYFLSQGYNPKSVILPPRISPIDSIIITNKHASLIECWIQKKSDDNFGNNGNNNSNNANISNRNNSLINYTKRLEFNWSLLYRASRDGYSSSDFHLKCDNRGACVVVIKIRGHDQIIGGFNPIGWYTSRYEYYSTSDSFIFSINLNNSHHQNALNQENIKLCRVKDASRAIYQDPTRGPTFGYPDLKMILILYQDFMLMITKYFR